MSPTLDRPDPPFRQIADTIRDEIRRGGIKPGERVPSVRTIVRDFGVAMATAQRALSVLREERYIEPQSGLGNVVTLPEAWGTAASDTAWRSRIVGRVYSDGEHARITDAGTAKASKRVATALGVRTSATVIRRMRVRYSGEQPVAMSTSWFKGTHRSAAPKLLVPERVIEGTFSYLAQATNRRPASWRDEYEPGIATAVEVERLQLRDGALVTRGRNWIYDELGETLEYGESVTTGRIAYRGSLGD